MARLRVSALIGAKRLVPSLRAHRRAHDRLLGPCAPRAGCGLLLTYSLKLKLLLDHGSSPGARAHAARSSRRGCPRSSRRGAWRAALDLLPRTGVRFIASRSGRGKQQHRNCNNHNGTVAKRG